MGQIQQTLAFSLLLILLLPSSFGSSLEDQKFHVSKRYELAAIENVQMIDNVKVAVTITEEMETIVDVLPQSDLISTCKTILKCSGIVGNLICYGYDLYFPQEDPVIEKLDEITKTLVGKLDEISSQIEKATHEIKAFIENKIFQEKVTVLVNQLISHITIFYTHRTPALRNKLNHTCKENTVESIFINMKTLLDSNAITNQLKYDGFRDIGFQRIESVYKNMTKQLLVAFPICETLVYGEIKDEKELEKRSEHIVKFVAEIEENLKEENQKRKRLLQIQMNTEVKNLRYQVEWFKRQEGSGWELVTIYGISQCGEHFAIVVTEVVQVAVRLFTQKKITFVQFIIREFLKAVG